jgi:chemotaxis protein methyltransferase CheR
VTRLPHATHLERFRSLVGRRLGLQLDGDRAATLAETLERRVQASRLTPEAYLDRLEREGPSRDEVRALAQETTIGETYFFRNVEQFRALSEITRALPRVRFLSAGCASGEETYTLAMVAREHAVSGVEVSITGVDVNAAAIAKALRGTYSAWSLRETPPEARRRWFGAAGSEFTVAPSLRSAVRFEERNLADDEPGLWLSESYDVVFCRNVLMYLTPEVARAVVARIGRALAPGGHLFLGSAENLRGLSHGFHLRQSHGTFYYQRKGAAAPMSDEPPEPSVTTPGDAEDLDASRWTDLVQASSKRIEELGERSGELAGRGVARAATFPLDMSRAVELLRTERFGDALQALGDPVGPARDPEALLLRAVLLTHCGRLDEAESVCRQLCLLDDMSAGAYYLLALCRERAGDPEGAGEHDRAAAYLDPGFAMPRLHLGLLARRAGDLEGARRQIEEARDLLAREDPSRILLFGGGFTREALAHLCQSELLAIGGSK